MNKNIRFNALPSEHTIDLRLCLKRTRKCWPLNLKSLRIEQHNAIIKSHKEPRDELDVNWIGSGEGNKPISHAHNSLGNGQVLAILPRNDERTRSLLGCLHVNHHETLSSRTDLAKMKFNPPHDPL